MGKKRAAPKARSRMTKAKAPKRPAETYTHPTAELLLRPDVGTQAQFRKKRPPSTHRHDSSPLSKGSGALWSRYGFAS